MVISSCKFQRNVAVEGSQGLEGVLARGLVLGHEGTDIHPLHLHLIDLYDIGTSLGETLFHQGEELVGIGQAGVQEFLFLVETYQVQAQQLGLQQDVPALESVLHVQGLALQLAGLAPRNILRREIEAHGDYELGAGDSVIATGKEGAVGYGEVLLEVVLGLDFEP